MEDKTLAEARYQDGLRRMTALSLQSNDEPITEVARQRVGTHGLRERQADQDQSNFTLEEAKEEGLDNLALCELLDGRVPPDFEEDHYRERTAEEIAGALRLAWRELNHILLDGLAQSMDEAMELYIKVPEPEVLEDLRAKEFHEDNESEFLSTVDTISRGDALDLMRKIRCELAWTKDNRDWLVDYIEMAKELNQIGKAHKLVFEFYARNMDVELMENRERETVRCAVSDEASAQVGAQSPPKRRRQHNRPSGSNDEDASQEDRDSTSESDNADDESSSFDDDMDLGMLHLSTFDRKKLVHISKNLEHQPRTLYNRGPKNLLRRKIFILGRPVRGVKMLKGRSR